MKTTPLNTKLMNTSIRAVMGLTISAGLLLHVARTHGGDQGRGFQRDEAGGGKLEGAWNVTVNICNNGPTVTRLNTFMFGGTMQEIAAFVSPPIAALRSPGHGIWEHSTDGNYTYT